MKKLCHCAPRPAASRRSPAYPQAVAIAAALIAAACGGVVSDENRGAPMANDDATAQAGAGGGVPEAIPSTPAAGGGAGGAYEPYPATGGAPNEVQAGAGGVVPSETGGAGGGPSSPQGFGGGIIASPFERGGAGGTTGVGPAPQPEAGVTEILYDQYAPPPVMSDGAAPAPYVPTDAPKGDGGPDARD